MPAAQHKTRMLILVSVLHAFTHIYQVALMPLYLPIQKGFGLASVGSSTFLVTLLMVSYFLPSYAMGVLADRVSRTKLLGAGLVVNAAGYLLLAWAPSYPLALAAMVVAGLGGSCFHPAATALIARLFPLNTGRALGLIGIGASLGFFFGPFYAGWRAGSTGNWRAPVGELGLFGLVAAALFLWLAEDTPSGDAPAHAGRRPRPGGIFDSASAALLFVGAAGAFSLRDFAGSSMGSLGSLFLQHAHGFSVRDTGTALSAIFVAATVSNPVFGHLSDGGRKRWGVLVHLVAAAFIVAFPHVPGASVSSFFLVFMAYGFFFMASYPIVEAGVMQAVHDSVRGRAFGLWITIGGLIGNLSHWLVGQWVESLGSRAGEPASYIATYRSLAGLLIVSLVGLWFLERVRERERGPDAAPPARRQPLSKS